jgi:undecaprenyl-diphosphatase
VPHVDHPGFGDPEQHAALGHERRPHLMFADGIELLAALLTSAWAGLVLHTTIGRRRWTSGTAPRAALLLAIGTSILLLAVQANLADRIHDAGGGATALDTAVWTYVLDHRGSSLTALAKKLNAAGGLLPLTVLTVCAASVLVLRRHRLEAAIVVSTPAVTGFVGLGSKVGYHRPRPPAFGHLVPVYDHSLPSGHTLDATTVIGVLAVVVASRVRGRMWRIAVCAVATTGIVAAGASRVYLGVHWATDVLTGWFLGGAWVALSAAVLLMLRPHLPALDPGMPGAPSLPLPPRSSSRR